MVRMAARYGHFSLNELRGAVESISGGQIEPESLVFSLVSPRASKTGRLELYRGYQKIISFIYSCLSYICHPERRSPWRPEPKDLRLLILRVRNIPAVLAHFSRDDSRTISSGSSTTVRCRAAGFSSSAMIILAVRSPISVAFWSTLESGTCSLEL
jgi:hypothetical protein